MRPSIIRCLLAAHSLSQFLGYLTRRFIGLQQLFLLFGHALGICPAVNRVREFRRAFCNAQSGQPFLNCRRLGTLLYCLRQLADLSSIIVRIFLSGLLRYKLINLSVFLKLVCQYQQTVNIVGSNDLTAGRNIRICACILDSRCAHLYAAHHAAGNKTAGKVQHSPAQLIAEGSCCCLGGAVSLIQILLIS